MSKKIMGVTVGTPIRPSKFATELADRVEEMVKANTEQEKTVDITENGTVEIVPDVGYKLTKVTANVNVPTASGDNKLAQLVDGTLTEITAEDLEGATKIRDGMFKNLPSLERVSLPDTLTTIEDNAFSASSENTSPKITNIVFPNSITKLGADQHRLNIYLQSVAFPQNAEFTAIPTSSFNGCAALNNVVIPNTVTRINSFAFNNCDNLTNITLSNSLTSISSSVFQYCDALTNLTIPTSINNIQDAALQCGSSDNKATFTFLGTTPPTIATNIFNANYLNKIIVPVGCGDAYRTATNWAKFADYIEEAAE